MKLITIDYAILMLCGLADPSRAPMTAAKVNPYVGSVMTAFGLLLPLLACGGAKV